MILIIIETILYEKHPTMVVRILVLLGNFISINNNESDCIKIMSGVRR
jgi:hypothetical protein